MNLKMILLLLLLPHLPGANELTSTKLSGIWLSSDNVLIIPLWLCRHTFVSCYHEGHIIIAIVELMLGPLKLILSPIINWLLVLVVMVNSLWPGVAIYIYIYISMLLADMCKPGISCALSKEIQQSYAKPLEIQSRAKPSILDFCHLTWSPLVHSDYDFKHCLKRHYYLIP